MFASSRWRAAVGVVAAAVLSVGVSACGSDSSGGAAGGDGSSGGEYVIGGDSDLSGGLAYIGTGLRDGARAYFEQVNTNGGINGHKIKFVPLDHRSDTATGIANVKNLVQNSKAIAVTGFDSSIILDAALPEIVRDKIVATTQGSTPNSLASEWAFAAAAYIPAEAQPMADLAAKLVKTSTPRVGILNQESAVVQAWDANMKKVLAAKGWPIASHQTVQLTATEVNAQVSAIVRSHPDVVFQTMSGPKIKLAVDAFRKLGYKGPIINHTPGADIVSLKSADDPDFYVAREFAFPADTGQGVAQMDAAIKAIGKDPATAWVINGYVQGLIIGEGLKKCGWPCSAEKLRDTLSNMTIDTHGITFSPIVYSAANRGGLSKLRFYKWSSKAGKPQALPGEINYNATVK